VIGNIATKEKKSTSFLMITRGIGQKINPEEIMIKVEKSMKTFVKKGRK